MKRPLMLMIATCLVVIPPVQAASDASSREAMKEALEQQFREELVERVYLITLEDGTRCAVLYERDSYGGTGGIDCDWRGRASRLNRED